MKGALAIAPLIALALAACARHQVPPADAYAAFDAAYEKAAGDAAKAELAERFLDAHPDSEHAAEAAETLVYHLGEKLGRRADADAFLVRLATRIEDPTRRRAVLVQRAALLGGLHRPDALRGLAREIAAIAPLTFGEHRSIGQAAVTATDWPLALEQFDAALTLATPETVRADDAKADADAVARGATRRRALALGGRGWALANLGRLDEAFAALDEGVRLDSRRYTGESELGVGLDRGRALLLARRWAEALDALAPEALFGNDDRALAGMRTAYAATRASDAGFDAYLWSTRQALARPVADFALPDYNGREHRFAALRNGEVTLLSFWFPT